MVTLTAAADSWKSWLDDAPLPETFNSATGGLQDFITALSRALLDARAELAATQTQVGDWIVRADEANVKVETLDAELATLRAQVERLTGALTIAANRLHRCSVDYDTGTREFIEVGEWADEARAALTEGAAP